MAVDFYLKIQGIEGESTAPGREGQIDVLSFSWGVSQPAFKMAIGVGAGTGSPRAAFKSFTISKRLDKATPKILETCARGRRVPTVEMTIVQRDEGSPDRVLCAYKFTDVLITSVNISGEDAENTGSATGGSTVSASAVGEDRPLETVTLNYSRMEVTYTGIQPDGTAASPVRWGWDLKVNKPL